MHEIIPEFNCWAAAYQIELLCSTALKKNNQLCSLHRYICVQYWWFVYHGGWWHVGHQTREL